MPKRQFGTSDADKRAALIAQEEQTTDPGTLIDIKLKRLRGDFEDRAHRLRTSGIAVDAHNRILTGWQNEYDRAKTGLTEDKSRLSLARRMERRAEAPPGYARDVGQYAMGLPSTRAGVTPSAVGLSPSQQKAYTEHLTTVAKESMVDPWGFLRKAKRKYADPDKLKDIFLNEWAIANLDDSRNINKRRGFIQSWKTAVAGNKHTTEAWKALSNSKTGDPEITMRLTAFSRLGDIARRKAGISPLGRSIIDAAPKSSTWGWPGHGVSPAPQPVSQPVSDPLGIR